MPGRCDNEKSMSFSDSAALLPHRLRKRAIRSDRNTDYTFMYKGEDVVLGAGKIISIADGLADVVLPTCAMKIMNNLIVIKGDVK